MADPRRANRIYKGYMKSTDNPTYQGLAQYILNQIGPVVGAGGRLINNINEFGHVTDDSFVDDFEDAVDVWCKL